jgi:SAM-dependent methyltransferase
VTGLKRPGGLDESQDLSDMPEPGAYEWRWFTECNMCGAGVAGARSLGRRLNQRQGLRPAHVPGAPIATIHRCTECGLVFANPMPVPAEIGSHYGIPPAAYWGETDLAAAKDYFSDQIVQFRRLYPRSERLTALDIGAGVGKAMVSLEAAGFAAYGLEPSANFHEYAISQTGIPHDRLSLGRIEDAEFAAEQFDLVTFGAVLEHLPDPAAAILSALCWTRTGGLIHVEVPSSDWLMARLVDFTYRMQRLDFTCHLSPLHIPFHLFEFTPASFERHAARTGYEVALCRRHVAQTYAPRWADAGLRRLMDLTQTGMQLEMWLRKSRPIEARSHR